ncbi:MAG: Maf family protein [Terriglobales bacterium]
MTASPSIILASASPRRGELLAAAGFAVEVCPATVDESVLADEAPAAYVLRLAQAKARAVPSGAGLVLGADTAVVVESEILGKPAGDAEARAMLTRLAGRDHQVLTGVCLRRARDGREACAVEATRVWLTPLTPEEIAEYVASGEPRDKAGAYAIQGRAARFIPRIEGSYSNVVGLPLATVWALWRQLAPSS